MNDDTQDDKDSIDENTNEDRREVLQKLGRYAYTAPVMLSLLASRKASAVSAGGIPVAAGVPG